MNELSLEIINCILYNINPKDYTNFILAYDQALELWYDKNIRKRYKEQFITYVETVYTKHWNHEAIGKLYQRYYIRKDTGEKHGRYLQYWSNGNLYCKEYYINGLIHCKRIEWSYIGELYYVIDYVYGLLNGKLIEFRPNGKVKREENFVNDKIHGKCIKYTITGSIYAVEIYIRGRMIIHIDYKN